MSNLVSNSHDRPTCNAHAERITFRVSWAGSGRGKRVTGILRKTMLKDRKWVLVWKQLPPNYRLHQSQNRIYFLDTLMPDTRAAASQPTRLPHNLARGGDVTASSNCCPAFWVCLHVLTSFISVCWHLVANISYANGVRAFNSGLKCHWLEVEFGEVLNVSLT